ncbi:MAG: sensor histidine kinase [Microcystis flos-aquae Mf_WU_F_19750830_S460]|uniref:histidine kinase n=1 Tax=Microcystis flos-aquae Mf_WU_F_19750830_S460 TaxID=2486237 RepID=A0A552LVX6_9CHRO|nr:MAG: sensor histidine kinase [Microcystis flos-aquae Mf_WU_F_19750830_S460]
MTEQQVKQQLQNALADKRTDYGRILALAHELSRQDQSSVRFSVDASHISRLGLELVSKQETAISELVKNAYDADSATVDVVFKNSSQKGGSLEVIDSGNGMTRAQLLDGFMRISTADKVSEPRSPVFGRQRAGRKGIGRFAAQRLGRRLRVLTQREGESYSLEIGVDWDKFQSGVDLHQIANQVVVAEPRSTKGTTLIIDGLRDAWTEAQIKRAYRYISELIQPFPLDRKSIAKPPEGKYKTDPGFKAAFYREHDNNLTAIASDEQDIYGAAIAKISARVDDKGQAWYSVESSRYPISIVHAALKPEPKLRSRDGANGLHYAAIGGVQLTAHYFQQNELPSGSRGLVREVLSRVGGIRLYRNGFRVLPYGEDYDDWLGLQRSSALRELLPPHHSSNFIGFVEIKDVEGERFQETASREGLVENEAFFQLQDFAYRALVAGVMEIARVRNKKVFASDERRDKPDSRRVHRGLRERASDAAARLREIATGVDTEQSRVTEEHDRRSFTAIADEIEQIGAKSEEALEEVGMLRVLASLGLTIGEFTHEVRHALAALWVAIEGVRRQGTDGALAERLADQVLLLRSYMRYFDDAVTQNAHRTLEAHELRDILNEFVEVMRPTLDRQKVKIELSLKGYDLFARPMHKSEWASILLNLFTNSLKAIHRASVAGRILISAKAVDEALQIDFLDNGDGIPPHNWEKVFDAFFTTSAPPGALSTHTEQLVGTGLGLKIVRDILDAAGGDIEVVEPLATFTTCIRINVPRARDDQIGHDRY